MKLSLISEVFQKPSMDGVETRYSMYHDSDLTASAEYMFFDDDNKYKVNITTASYDSVIETMIGYSNIDPSMYDDIMAKIRGAGGLPCYIALDANGSYAKTGFNNEFYVYGKVISCVHDFVVKNKPIAIKFSGYTSDMDRVYDRFVKMGNKLWPEYRYIPVSGELYLSVPTYRIIRDIPGFEQAYDSGITKRNDKLSNALDSKKLERQRAKQPIMNYDNGSSAIDRFVGDL